MIKCKICNQEFKSMLTNSHLKRHNITLAEYKEQYGEVVSDEWREIKRIQSTGENNPNFGKRHNWTDEQKDKIKGRPAHNKGILMSALQKKILSEKALERNKSWRDDGYHPSLGRTVSEETKEKIRAARKHQVITKEQLEKSLKTKKENGYDLAFFRGRKHSDKSKKKISEKSKITNKLKSDVAKLARNNRLTDAGFELINEIDTSVHLKCPVGHLFSKSAQYLTLSKFDVEMCPICFPPLIGTSNAEHDLFLFISQFTKAVLSERSIISPKELDIFLPDFNIAIEYHGLYWHSELYKDPNYHKDKLQLCQAKGIRLIQIFEDEWLLKQDIVKARLLSFIGNNITIPARKCIVKEVRSNESNKFLNEYHIQGKGRANVHLGLYYNNDLVSVMSFLNGDISKGVNGWELNRFCTKSGISIAGGASKLFSSFVKTYKPDIITSFADLRWCSNNPVYHHLGFERKSNTTPNYWYFKPKELIRHHRYSLRKPAGGLISERELRNQEGWIRIYDCGHAKFVWTKKSSP